tara:strand:- start:313 stop:690 length:378 start_codon:yes stop_codon:yes gene_type:complete
MIWNDRNTVEMLRLYNLGLTGVQVGDRMGCSANSVRGRRRALREKTEVGKVKRFSSGVVGKNTQRVVSNKYKVFRVLNTVTGVVFKISGMGDDLPDETLKSATVGEVRRKKHKVLKHMMEYERLM